MTTCNLTCILTTEFCCINECTDHFTPHLELFGIWLAVPCHQKLSIFYGRVKTNEMLPSTKFSLPACSERNEEFQVFPHFVRLPEIFHTIPFNHSIIKPLRKSHAKISSSLSVAVCINHFLHMDETAPAETKRMAMISHECYRLIREKKL